LSEHPHVSPPDGTLTVRQLTTRYVGIDPGLTGAIAVLLPDGTVSCFDAPVEWVQRGRRKGREYDVAAMRRLLVTELGDPKNVCVVLERNHGMPHEGVRSVCSICRGVALWEGICCGLGLGVRRVLPQEWKTHAGLIGAEKCASRICAAGHFPLVDLGPRTMTGRADALLIAVYGRARAF